MKEKNVVVNASLMVLSVGGINFHTVTDVVTSIITLVKINKNYVAPNRVWKMEKNVNRTIKTRAIIVVMAITWTVVILAEGRA